MAMLPPEGASNTLALNVEHIDSAQSRAWVRQHFACV